MKSVVRVIGRTTSEVRSGRNSVPSQPHTSKPNSNTQPKEQDSVERLTRSGHDRAQDMVDASRMALAVLPEPIVNVAIEMGSHQHFWRAAELRQLLICERRDFRIVNSGLIGSGLTLRNPRQYRPLPLLHRFGEYRFGTHVDSLPAPR